MVKTEFERVGEHVYFRTLVRFGDVLNCFTFGGVRSSIERETEGRAVSFLSFFREQSKLKKKKGAILRISLTSFKFQGIGAWELA